ncbi:hypothetical protein BDW02DRAFT_494125 [Decorospora gaudefroyi]|uniref:F-box domain-containing protein n=1 Tax=Decorospora gaudefroyi TaxID=184978 RepID=A0A6A5KK72_9PLEO|nr:hypothetical protein BDW02DRAFT_494125 [Decorospora gaudefroyi]
MARSPKNTTFSDLAVPRSTKTPWELERSKKISSWRRRKPVYVFPAHIFKDLPREVYDCIVAQLEQIHLGLDQACPSCYLRDLRSLSLTSRTWDKAASAAMYRDVWVLTNEEHGKLPKSKIGGTSRLKLLRRTLRGNSGIARRVRELHLSDFQTLYQHATIERGEIANLIASLVMACPLLERLVGFHIPFSHAFDRLSHAISTRSNLKERAWILAEEDGDSEDEDGFGLNGHYVAACDPTERFLDFNSNHAALSSLILHQEPGRSYTPLKFRAVVGSFRHFPNLRHLSISGLVAASFTNLTFKAIPAKLLSLRLEKLPGVTESGIRRFVTSQLAVSIEKLALIDMEISSLHAISEILSAHLTNLKDFSFAQERAPTLLGRNSVPDFYSASLRYIHWELYSEASPLPAFPPSSSIDLPESASLPFTSPEPICCLATSLLAASIRDNAFPSLRRIRIPYDPQGVIQSLCKPLATALLPHDTSKFATAPRISTLTGFSMMLDEHIPLSPNEHTFSSAYTVTLPSRVDAVLGSPTFAPSLYPRSPLPPIRSRLAAQARILAARRNAAMAVRVFDPEGKVRLDKAIGGYVGLVGSKITYDLKADGGSSSERSSWITGIEDLVGDRDTEGADGEPRHMRGSCGHVVGVRVGKNVVRVEEMF